MGDADWRDTAIGGRSGARRRQRARLAAFAQDLIADGRTPIFEFTGPENRIVVAYPESSLTLLAVRDRRSGVYVGDAEMRRIAAHYGVPAIRAWGSDVGDLASFLAHVRGLEGAEGYVVRFENGVAVKLKAYAYVLRRRVLSDIASEKFALRAALEGAVDDLTPLLAREAARALEEYAALVRAGLAARAAEVEAWVEAERARLGDDRKAFAGEVNAHWPAGLRPAAFKAWERADVAAFLRAQVLKASAQTFDRIEAVRDLIGGARWSLKVELEV